MRNWVVPAAVVLSVPVALFLALWMMRTFFILPGAIKNDSSRTIEVLPVGRVPTTGRHVGRAPLFRAKFPPILAGAAPLSVAPGATTTFFYDFDDINLCWLLVRDGGAWKVQPTTMEQSGPCALEKVARGKPCCGGLEDVGQHVAPLETLADAPPWLSCLADNTCA